MSSATSSKKNVKPAKKAPTLSDELNALMDSVLAGIKVDKDVEDTDPLDEDDVKGEKDYARVSRLFQNCNIARVIFAWKWKTENTQRKRGDGKAEDEKNAERLGLKCSTARAYYQGGRAAHVLYRAGIKFRNLPRSVDALIEFGKLQDEHIVDCYESCKENNETIDAKAAAKSVLATMEEHPDDYKNKKKKGAAKKAQRGSYKEVFAETKPASIKARVEKFCRENGSNLDQATQEAMKRDMKLYKEIANIYMTTLNAAASKDAIPIYMTPDLERIIERKQ